MNLRPANACDFARLFDIHQSVFRSHIEKFLGWDETTRDLLALLSAQNQRKTNKKIDQKNN